MNPEIWSGLVAYILSDLQVSLCHELWFWLLCLSPDAQVVTAEAEEYTNNTI